MAAAALLSLARSLHQILNQENYSDPLHKEKLVSPHEKVDSVASFLQDYSDKCGGTLDIVENGIREAAYEAQDFVDSYLRSVSTTDVDSSSSKSCNEASVDQGLNMALERINFIWEEVMKMKNRDKAEDLPSRTHSSPVDHSSKVKITAPNIVVGFEDDLKAIKERLYEDSAKLEIIPIVGMGGLGKTTLARKAYDDSLLGKYFDICAWITLSAEYQRREILTRLLQSFKKATDDLDENLNGSDAQLAIFLYQKLVDRRYLIVIDDIWSTKAWDDLKMIFPDNSNGSRILLTTRISGVAVHAGSSSTRLHKMDFLDEDRSWKLLGERIFGQESCPPQLMEIGKKIARSCGGLPLTIVVVAGLILSTGDIMKQELWENISENISSEPTIELQCSKILCLSYDRLPLGLKPCFLYITAFPEDHEIDVSKLIMLWVAEGFLELSDKSKCLEDVGEQYLEDLVNRSLILVSQRGPNGNLETVGIHDLLREICMVKAKEEGFFHLASSKRNAQKDAGEKPNLCINIHCPQVFQEWQIEDSSVYSVLLFYDRLLYSRLSPSCWHLTILDASELTRQNFPDVVSTFVNLRYIAIASSDMQCTYDFVVSLCKLPNLQTIILHDSRFSAPDEIWEMPKLRHLIAGALFYSSCPNIRIDHKSDLQTLETVFDLRFTDEFIKIFVNLKKLKVVFDQYADQKDHFNLNNLFRLQNLEELEVGTHDVSNSSVLWDHAFPTSLKKLTLEGVPFPWKNMTMIGSLPHLQVLQVTDSLLSELSEWAPIEGQFLRLKYLRSSLSYLERWEVEKEHFPSLESLVLEYVISMDEIPCSIGEIDSLQLIELRYCERSLVNSAKLIQEQQHECGNYAFQIRIIKCYE